MSSISRVLRSKLKQPDGPGEEIEEREKRENNSGNNPIGHDSSKHSIDDILATSPAKEHVESDVDDDGKNLFLLYSKLKLTTF